MRCPAQTKETIDIKGVKVTLDTKVQPNLIDWRKLNNYDASKDVITVSVSSGLKDIYIEITRNNWSRKNPRHGSVPGIGVIIKELSA